ncbi:MAG: hypothetical protein DRI95_15020 [Bacteroidetes bacterium]|nr:MAG: hypothetical protein DRI95_15020 [Bacteroidota bacterium]
MTIEEEIDNLITKELDFLDTEHYNTAIVICDNVIKALTKVSSYTDNESIYMDIQHWEEIKLKLEKS